MVRALSVLGFWTLVGLLSGLQSTILGRMEGQDVSLLLGAFRAVPPWWFWALATPAVGWMARRFPLEGGHWPASLAAHVGGALVATALHALWVGAFFLAIGATAAMTETIPEYLRLIFVSRLYLDLLTYAAVLGAVYAFDYHDRFQERRLRASRLEAQLATARLDALRMQLNPHFLFNTLNTVAAQVRAGRAGVATSMLSGLGELLRYVLDSDQGALVPLGQERAFLERYLEI
ncbi:MAG: histidine kinase, partial [Longimicrobiales bacterium]